MQPTLLVLALIVAFVASKCTNGHSAVKQTSGLCTCQWYNDKGGSCCPQLQGYQTPKDASDLYTNSGNGACMKKTNSGPRFPCKGADSQCYELINLAQCGVSCSPDQDKFHSSKGFKLCKEFSARIWKSCKDQEYFSNSDWECKKVSDIYENVTSLIANSGLPGAYIGDDDKDCLSSASSTAPAAFVTLAAVGAVAGIRNPLFITLLLVALSSVLVSADCYSGKPASVKSMTYCSWYKDNTCCPTSSIKSPTTEYSSTLKKSAFEVKSVCTPMSASCLDSLAFARCSTCSPKQKEIGGRICDSQAKKIYDSCQDQEMFDSNGWRCKPIKDVYENSSALISSLGLSQDDGTDCWNASTLEFFSLAIVALLGLALY